MLQTGSKNILHAVYDFNFISWSGKPDSIDGICVSQYKGKGEKSICDHYRGITLLESLGKVLARLLLNRLTEDIYPDIILKSQNGFRSGRGTVDMIFSVRQIQEKCIEQQRPLHQVSVDLTKAFDTVNTEALLKILTNLDAHQHFQTCSKNFIET